MSVSTPMHVSQASAMPRSLSVPPRLLRDWVAACVGGEAIGIGVAAAAVAIVLSVVGEAESAVERWTVFTILVATGAIEGLALGGLQWRVLRRAVSRVRARAWIGATVAVAVVGWAVGMLPSTLSTASAGGPVPEPSLVLVLLGAGLGGAAAGVVFGGVQWMVLRRHVAGATRWIWANALGWGLAMAWIFLAASALPSGAPGLLVASVGVGAGVLSGVSLGGVTGWALVSLVRQGGDE